MHLFDTVIDEVRQYQEGKKKSHLYREFAAEEYISWPTSGSRDMILIPDMAVELGGAENASVSLTLWTQDTTRVSDGRITLIGSDLSEFTDSRRPLGKIVIVRADGFDELNTRERCIEMDLIRYDLLLKGYMIKAAPQYMREWSRVSKEAVNNNLSLSIVGNALIHEYKKRDYIHSAEVMFVTSSDEDVAELMPLARRSKGYINAMSKMVDEMDFDCSECDYRTICDEAEELREMRNKLAGTAT